MLIELIKVNKTDYDDNIYTKLDHILVSACDIQQ